MENGTGRRGRKRSTVQYKQVALAINANTYSFQRRKIEGIIDYYQKHCGWDILRDEQLRPFVMPEDLTGWSGDGVIGEIYSDYDKEIYDGLTIPMVNTSSSELAGDIPTVRLDNYSIGRMAAEHLLECNLDRFAFVGATKLAFARERKEGFVERLEAAGNSCEVIEYEPVEAREDHNPREIISPDLLMDKLAALELPVGIMASSDRTGFIVLEACRRMGLRSPEDLAVIGSDNDKMHCDLAYSSMTSIEINAHEVGFQAAAMLDKLMRGEELVDRHVLIPPNRVVFRNSTDMTRSTYPEVARALRFIRNHAGEFIDVSNVLDVVPVSRRWLEMKFKAEVGHGIYQEIRRVHIERSKELLSSTDWAVSRIAKESGFNNTERFECAFQKLLEMSATEYRAMQAAG